MGNKFANYLTLGIIAIILIGVIALLVEPLVFWTEYSEIRLYVRLFLIMFAVNTFAVLRLYNSIVQNTRFSIRLRESFIRLTAFIPGLERAIKNLGFSLNNVKASTDALKKGISDNTDKVEKVLDKINRVSNSKT